MTSTRESVKTTEFEQSITVAAPADRIFDYLSEAAMNEGISKTLESIKRICEGQGGKEEIEANK